MAKAIFFSIPAHGHTNPTLPVVAELVRMGDEITYYSTIAFKGKIEATGARFMEYRNSANFDTSGPGKNLGLLFFILTNVTYGLLDELIRDIDAIRPDYIIHDAACLWGRYVASIRGIPAVASISTFAFSKRSVSILKSLRFISSMGWAGISHMRKASPVQRKMEAEYGIPASSFLEAMMNEEGLNIVYTSKLFQPFSETFDANRYKFVGPSIAERPDETDIADYASMRHPLVYVSLGTIWKDAAAIDAVIGALKEDGYSIVVSSSVNADLYTDNPRIVIKSHVDQLRVLRSCDAFITHGGMNSVSEALYLKVPTCLYPFQPEQEEVARRVVELGCGIRIRKLSKEEIKRTVSTILIERSYKVNCCRIAASLKEAGGFGRAAECIKKYAEAAKSEHRSSSAGLH